MTYVTRRRTLRTHHRSGVSTRDRTKVGLGIEYFPWDVTFHDRQITTSEGHRWPKGRGVRDVGGNFDTIKLSFRSSDLGGSYYATGIPSATSDFGYNGSCTANVTAALGANPLAFTKPDASDAEILAWVPTSSEGALTALGTSMIANTIPTNPTVDGSVALAELYREGIPSMIGAAFLRDKASFFRSLGSEYLSLEFGWKPLVSDLKSAAKAIIDSDEILKQLARDSGKNVRRRRSLQRQTTFSSNGLQSNVVFMSALGSGWFDSASTYRVSELQTRQQSFSGCYTYHYDPGHMSTVERISTQARLLYGLELTPEVLWNLAPWSWLVDWVTDVGPLLGNLSAFQQDGLVLRYGYVMEENFRRVRRTNERGNIPKGTSLPRSVTETFVGKRQVRRKATPYGFGLDFAGFSARQWSILLALGITRAPGRL